MSDERLPKDRPPVAKSRWLRLGATGATMAVHGTVSRLRKVGASVEKRQAIAQATEEANATRLFDVLAGSRGVLMKIGQTLAQQSHSLSSAYVEKLATLQWEAPPMHGTLARRQFRLQLGIDPEEAFAEFEHRPFAAASLGQVHRARLKDGTAIVVKIQYPGIDRTVDGDLDVVRRLLRTASLGRRRAQWLASLEEVRERFRQEVDYFQEASNLQTFAALARQLPHVVVPCPIDEFSSRGVLTMEFVEGRHAVAFLAENPSQKERDHLASRLLEVFFHQLFDWGMLHADPHPGNILFQPDGGIGLIDFGCVKTLEPGFMNEMQRLFSTPLDEETVLDRIYRRLGLYDPSSPQGSQQRQLLLRLQHLDAGKYHHDTRFDFSEGDYLKELSGIFRRMIHLGLTHPQFVFIVRTKFGLYNLFHQLKARINVYQILQQFL